jgi:hypothetical protein
VEFFISRMKHDDYTVGWICALLTEMAVALAKLDERHDSVLCYGGPNGSVRPESSLKRSRRGD